jgi:Holliday junction resolvase
MEIQITLVSSHKIRKKQLKGVGIIFQLLENSDLQLYSTADQLMMAIQSTLKEARQPHRVHGIRVEAMFSYVVGALGKCILIKQEDTSGICLAENIDFNIPDYKVILKDGSHFFVEVKNCHLLKIKFKKNYIKQLLVYTDIHKLPLKIAVYWSKLKVWTLVSVKHLIFKSHETYVLGFERALAISEMATLGDASIGTRLPLVIRLLGNPRNIDQIPLDSEVELTINKVEIYSRDVLIEEDLERNLAFKLILWGEKDHSILEIPLITEGKLTGIEYRMEPYEEAFDQGFQIIGSLSTMISNQYNAVSAPDGNVGKLIPSNEPEQFSIYIPVDYKGKYLPIWRITQIPNPNFT